MAFKYKYVLGGIIFSYIAVRPDIYFVMKKLSKFSENPAKYHFVAIKTVVSYFRQDL